MAKEPDIKWLQRDFPGDDELGNRKVFGVIQEATVAEPGISALFVIKCSDGTLIEDEFVYSLNPCEAVGGLVRLELTPENRVGARRFKAIDDMLEVQAAKYKQERRRENAREMGKRAHDRQRGVATKTELRIAGHGTVTLEGTPVDTSDASIVNLLAAQVPARKIVAALAAMVANRAPTNSSLQGLCQILAQQTPTEDFLRSLADLVAEENPHVHTLIDGQRPTGSALKTLADLAARQTPSIRIVQALANLVAELLPSVQLQRMLAEIVKGKAGQKAEQRHSSSQSGERAAVTTTVGSVVINGVEVPKALLNVTHGRKTWNGSQWVLATRNGCRIAEFGSEAALEEWWRLFQQSQGRVPNPLSPASREGAGRLLDEVNGIPRDCPFL
jgi:hypothetical protein